MKEKSFMGIMRDAMDKMQLNDEWVYDVSNRNFTSLRNTFNQLKLNTPDFRSKKFVGTFSEDKQFYKITRTA